VLWIKVLDARAISFSRFVGSTPIFKLNFYELLDKMVRRNMFSQDSEEQRIILCKHGRKNLSADYISRLGKGVERRRQAEPGLTLERLSSPGKSKL